MDKKGFRLMLEGRHVPPEKMDAALSLAQRYDDFAKQADGFSTESAWAFARMLIAEGLNSEENFITLARYGLFIKKNPVYLAMLELLDGGEAQENLYHLVAKRHGTVLRDEVFKDIGLAPYGTPTPEKPRYMHPVVQRLEDSIGTDGCRELLADSLRDLPDEMYAAARDMYRSSRDVDEYLQKKKQAFVAQLETCQREGRLFFAQEITDEVLEYVNGDEEIGGGVRVGNVVYETKIPFMTREYLAASDPVQKRYYYCHCPWAREAVKNGEKVAPIFCNCSAGFHKKPWEAALGKRIQVDVLESVLMGDERCRFAIHLPEECEEE